MSAVPATYIAISHTIIAASAFLVALAAGWLGGLWKELCINEVAGWPIEWFPSVSAVIGDHATARAPFHILIALCSGPRFLVLYIQWLMHRQTGSGTTASLVNVELLIGFARTLCCGGWMYVTSRDNHDLHDIFMIVYLILNLPWMLISIRTSTSRASKRRRRACAAGFLASIPPLLLMYYRHSKQKIPGAYTHYAFLEWSLVIWDVAFDANMITDFRGLEITIASPTGGISGALPKRLDLDNEIEDKGVVGDWTQECHGQPSSAVRAFVAWSSDLYFMICFWSTFTALSVQLFYWSVWKLALAGSEAALIANLSAYLLISAPMRRFFTSRLGTFVSRSLLSTAGMGAFALPTPAARLTAVSIGTAAGWLALYGDWFRLAGSREMIVEAQTLLCGICITMLLKYVNYSVNPFWCVVDSNSGGWNKTGLIIGVLGLVEYAQRPIDLFPATPSQDPKDTVRSHIPDPSHNWTLSLGLGALIHLIQTFLSDGGTIIAWTWIGYPVNGPTIHPFAGVVIAVASLSPFVYNLLSPVTWSALGVIAGGILLYSSRWLAFLTGLVLIAYLSAITPRLLQHATLRPFATTFGNAMLFHCILDVVSVVTAAYAFVPYGWIFRERTDLVILGGISCVEISRYIMTKAPTEKRSSLAPRTVRRVRRYSRWNSVLMLLVSILACSFSYMRSTAKAPVPYHPSHRVFSAGIWTIHFGIDEAGHDSQRRMLELVRDMEVDVLGLLETDLHRFVYGNRDVTRMIAEELGYYVDMGPGPNRHTWGAALLSKFPIVNSTHHLLPSPHGELAPAIHATLDIHGEMVNVLVSHNGQEEDALDRELQTTEIARLLRESEDIPSVFLGYLVTHPGDQRPWPYQILMEDGRMNDIEVSDRWRWCEYIAFRGLWRIAFARVHEGSISDTELQVGKFLLPRPGTRVQYESAKEMYWHIGEDDIPELWHMPQMFRGSGVRGHYYTTWDGPLYYLPPERSGLQRYGAEMKG